MLYEFHRKQNSKKPGSVHASYLITGTRIPQTPKQPNGGHGQDKDGEDTVMRSSPPMPSSSMPQPEEEQAAPVPVRSVLIVKEEHLDKAKATFEQITAIHVYSLQAKGLSDLHALTECNRKIAADYASEDPLVAWKQYGTIQDPNVKRRTQRRGPPPPPSVKEPVVKAKPAAPTTKPTALDKQASSKASTDSQPTSAKATPEPEKSTATANKGAASKPATNKRQSSDIFKSFAKGASKPKKAAGSTESSAAPTPAPPEDEEMSGMFDDDEPEDEPVKEEVEVNAGSGKSKKDRQAELEAMMDAEDEDEKMEDATDGAAAAGDSQEAEVEEQSEKAESQPKEEPKETVTVENGRRRGRRRTMKKKTVKDEEGYLGKSGLVIQWRQHPNIDSSHTRRTRLGVLLRRRACAQEAQDGTCSADRQVDSEEGRRQTRPG